MKCKCDKCGIEMLCYDDVNDVESRIDFMECPTCHSKKTIIYDRSTNKPVKIVDDKPALGCKPSSNQIMTITNAYEMIQYAKNRYPHDYDRIILLDGGVDEFIYADETIGQKIFTLGLLEDLLVNDTLNKHKMIKDGNNTALIINGKILLNTWHITNAYTIYINTIPKMIKLSTNN